MKNTIQYNCHNVLISTGILTLSSGTFSFQFIFLDQQTVFTLSTLTPLQTSCLTAALLTVPSMTDRTDSEMRFINALCILLQNDRRDTRYIFRTAVLPGPPPTKSPPIQISYQSVIHKVGQTHGRITYACRTKICPCFRDLLPRYWESKIYNVFLRKIQR